MDSLKRPRIADINWLFLILSIGLLTIGSLVQKREIYSGLLITEYLLVLIPCIFFLKRKEISFKKTLRLNRLGFKNTILVIMITIFAYPLVAFINAVFLKIITSLKDVNPTIVPVPVDDVQYLFSIFVIAVTPGICEEIMFRGLIMSAYEKEGRRRSIFISAILFGIFHFNLLNLIGPIILGVLFGFMVYKTKSIFSSIIAHTVNNAIAISLLYMLGKYGDNIDKLARQEGLLESNLKQGFLVLLIMIVLSSLIFFKLFKKLSPLDEEADQEEDLFPKYARKSRRRSGYLPLLFSGMIFIYVNWKFIFQ